MKKENDELFDLFRTRLEHAEVEVRNNFWEQLENNIPVVIRNRRRLMMQRFSAAASILLVLAGVSAAFWHFSPKDEIADAFTKMEIPLTTPKATINNDGIKEELPSIHTNVAQPSKQLPQAHSTQSAVIDEEEESFSFSVSVSISVTENRRSETKRKPGTANSLAGAMGNANPQEESTETTPAALPDIANNNNKAWELGLYASTIAINGRENNHIKHKLPFSAGLSVKKNLTDRFFLESGLAYTQLNSDITEVNEDIYHTQNQKLHYLGIPVRAGYTLLENDQLELYATGGGMIEKCISGKPHKADPLQFSLIASLGVQYKFNERMSVYAEPGLVYYFDDGSPVSTIRKEKPLNFNLLCGVRMTY